MVDHRDIRESTRTYRHRGKGFTVVCWSTGEGKHFVRSIQHDGFPPNVDADAPGFDSLDEAFADAEVTAKEEIDE